VTESNHHLPESELKRIEEQLQSIRNRIRVTKLVATRSIKSRAGDVFIGYSAHFQSHQDDGADQVPEADEINEFSEQGLPLEEAKIARLLLSMEADIGALEASLANGSISEEFFKDSLKALRSGYNKRLAKVVGITHD
jgi:hypothetical protein